VARSTLRFGVPLALANLLSWVVLNADYVIVGRVAGALILGFYVLAFNIASWPMSALGQAVRAVALPGFASLTDRQRQATSLRSALALGWAVALLIGIVLSCLASAVIGLVYGRHWLPASAALGGLAFFGALRIVFDLIATYLVAVGGTRAVLVVQVVWLLALVPAMIVGIRGYGLSGAGWAHVAAGVAIVLPAYLIVLRREGSAGPGDPGQLRLRDLAGSLGVPLLAALPAMAVALVLARVVDSPLVALLAGGAGSTVVYAAILAPWLRLRLRELRAPAAAQATPVGEADLVAVPTQ
jgi:PST family polysaccharide transporter